MEALEFTLRCENCKLELRVSVAEVGEPRLESFVDDAVDTMSTFVFVHSEHEEASRA